MRKMLPLAMYIAIALMCQTAAVVIALAVEQFGFKWGSVTVFGVLYLIMFGVAWKLTVLIMDGVLAKRGLLHLDRSA